MPEARAAKLAFQQEGDAGALALLAGCKGLCYPSVVPAEAPIWCRPSWTSPTCGHCRKPSCPSKLEDAQAAQEEEEDEEEEEQEEEAVKEIA